MRLPATDHVPAATVRFWALLDTGVLSLALPFAAPWFIAGLYGLNGLLGGVSTAPAFDPLALFFVNLSGVMVLVWVAARLLHPVGVLALVDTLGRSLVSALIAYFILVEGAIPVLWLFVGTEMAGAIAQGRALLRRPA
ncbi:MAG: hypothetical protein C0434_17095 [Xanthomonadaceae bacterium]|nr:hypothetical protein [Xanthomonadaceae bacterium]